MALGKSIELSDYELLSYFSRHANYYMAVEDIEAQLAPANPESIEEKL